MDRVGTPVGDDRAVIRDFEAADQDPVRDLVLAGLRERWGDVYDPTFNPDLDDIVGEYIHQDADVIVADVDGAIVACGMVVVLPEGRGQIRRVSVDEAHRREGLGRLIVAELIDRARRRGMAELIVRADTPWTSALELYRSCGFAEVGHDDVDTHFSMRL